LARPAPGDTGAGLLDTTVLDTGVLTAGVLGWSEPESVLSVGNALSVMTAGPLSLGLAVAVPAACCGAALAVQPASSSIANIAGSRRVARTSSSSHHRQRLQSLCVLPGRPAVTAAPDA